MLGFVRRRGYGAAFAALGFAVVLVAGTAAAQPTPAAGVTAARALSRTGVPIAAGAGGRVAPPTKEDSLAGISCTALSRCWAVGYTGTSPSFGGTLTERWDRRTQRWVQVASPRASGADETNLNDVSCTSSSSCMAVGAKETASFHISTVSERWNGHTWSLVPTPHLPGHPSSIFWGVDCTSAHNCWGVGSYVTDASQGETHTLFEHYNGSTWSVVTSSNPFDSTVLYKVSCASPTSCLAVGDYVEEPFGYAYAEHWNGTAWTAVFSRRVVTSQSTELLGASCPTTTRCVAVGNYALEDPASTLRTLAAQWSAPATLVQTLPPNPSPTVASQLIGDACPRASECVGVGDEDFSANHVKTLAELWNGSAWTVVATPDAYRSRNIELLDVSCPGTSDCFAVGVDFGRHTTTLGERWRGHAWSVVPTDNP
jgi:hypothetical protein